ncbi:MAG: MIP family channel protein [Nitrososphaerota archaeon]|jgi:aquaporin Z|nr:MIP family channel protein [Nitrososphaerota archaeon]
MEEKIIQESVPKPIAKYTAELIGTMVLVLLGCGSAVIAGYNIGYVGIAFAFGLAVVVMVYTFGSISGCHINPAITISMLIAGKISVRDSAFYIVFQCIGAIIGSGILYAIVSGTPSFNIAVSGLGQNSYSTDVTGFSLVALLIAEVALTFIFVLVVHGATHARVPKGFAGVAIGSALTLVHLVGIPITGTSVNPARSLGPAVIVGIFDNTLALSQLWLFWLAPIVGGILAALVWKIFK